MKPGTWARFGALIAAHRGSATLRDVCVDIGVSAGTINRTERGGTPDVETFARLCAWASIDPAEFLREQLEDVPAASTTRIPLDIRSVRAYLDHAIASWRIERNYAQGTHDGDSLLRATCYVDAFQSVRVSLIGDLFP